MAHRDLHVRFLPNTGEENTEWELQIPNPSPLQQYMFEAVKRYLDEEPFNPFIANLKARVLVEELSRIDLSYKRNNGVQNSEIAQSMWDIFFVVAKQIPVLSRRHYRLSLLIDEMIWVHQQDKIPWSLEDHAPPVAFVFKGFFGPPHESTDCVLRACAFLGHLASTNILFEIAYGDLLVPCIDLLLTPMPLEPRRLDLCVPVSLGYEPPAPQLRPATVHVSPRLEDWTSYFHVACLWFQAPGDSLFSAVITPRTPPGEEGRQPWTPKQLRWRPTYQRALAYLEWDARLSFLSEVLKDEALQSIAQSSLRNLRRMRDEYMGRMALVSNNDNLESMGFDPKDI